MFETKPFVVSQNCCYVFYTTDRCTKSASLDENDGSSFSLPQYASAPTVQSVPGPSWQSDVEPQMTQPCTTLDTKPLKNLPTTVTSNNARYRVSFYDSPDDRLSFTPVVPTSVYTPRPLRETPVNPNLTAIEAVANLRDVL